MNLDLAPNLGDSPLIRITEPSVGARAHHRRSAPVMPSTDSRGSDLALDAELDGKPFEEIAPTLRRRLDRTLQVCRCGGTGADGCIIDSPLTRANPRAGYPSAQVAPPSEEQGHE
ncbi:MAG: hypothetical protein SFW67_25965 [Myxococcaceae bacterium]|nr:hypothetical protein [Myxococcaceae bacterium]